MAVAEGDKGVQSLDTLASTESTPPYPKKDPDSGLRSFTPAPSSTSASTHPSDSVSDFGHGSFTPDLLTDGEVDKVGTNALGSCSLLSNDIPPSSLDDKLGPGGDDDPGGGNALLSSPVKSPGNMMVQTGVFLLTDDPGGLTDDPGGGKPPDDPGGDTPPVGSPSAPPLDDPGGGDTMDDKDKDNPHTDDDPPLSTKVHLGSSSANDSPGSRDFDTPYLLASSNSKASRFSPISVTMAPLNKLTGEVMNTTMDENSFGTLLMDDPGDVDLHAGLWWTDVDCAMRSYVHNYGG